MKKMAGYRDGFTLSGIGMCLPKLSSYTDTLGTGALKFIFAGSRDTRAEKYITIRAGGNQIIAVGIVVMISDELWKALE